MFLDQGRGKLQLKPRGDLECGPAQPRLLAQAACVRHPCLCTPCVAWPLLSPSFGLLSFFFSSPSFAFHPLRGNSHVRNNFTQYFGITRRYMQKKNIFGGKFYFFKKKRCFFPAVFLLFMASVRSRPPGPPAVPGVF